MISKVNSNWAQDFPQFYFLFQFRNIYDNKSQLKKIWANIENIMI